MRNLKNSLMALGFGAAALMPTYGAIAQAPSVSDIVPAQDKEDYLVEAAVASFAAYEDTDARKAQALGYAGLEFVSSYEGSNNISATVAKLPVANGPDIVFIAYRGTEVTSIANIITDLSMYPTPITNGTDLRDLCPAYSSPYCFVHAGFEDAAQDFALAAELAMFVPRGYRYIVTGHSLGGALAQLVAAHAHATLLAWDDDGVVDRVITFGGPKVGNGGFKSVYEAEADLNLKVGTHRWIMDGDPVPCVTNYSHAGPTHLLVESGGWFGTSYSVDETAGDYETGACDSIGAHSMSNYVSAAYDITDQNMPFGLWWML